VNIVTASFNTIMGQMTEMSQQKNRCLGVPRLDGAQDKKQGWRPYVRTWGLLGENLS